MIQSDPIDWSEKQVLFRTGHDYTIESRDNGNVLSLVSRKDGQTLSMDFSQNEYDGAGFPNKFLRKVFRNLDQTLKDQLTEEIEDWLRADPST